VEEKLRLVLAVLAGHLEAIPAIAGHISAARPQV
jgi:hypothetical protein